MSNGSRTAEDVAVMENELHYLRNELDAARRDLAVVTSEKSRLQIENALLAGKAQENLVKATRMETIMRSVSAGLLAGLNEMQQERDMARAVRRAVQESTLERETGAAPSFLRDRTVPLTRDVAVEETTRLAIDQPPRKLGTIDHTLAGHDSRIPPADYPGPNEDVEELVKLVEGMEKK